MKRKHQRALVLNADGTPMGLIGWKRAVTLSLMNQSDASQGLIPISYYKDDYVKAGRGREFPIPAVVVVPRYVKKNSKGMPFSRKNVFLRDRMTCQYCGFTDGTSRNLTYDHVIPRSVWKKKGYKGTPTHWENIVTCCEPCNKKKADQTPKQAGMKLMKEPVAPNPKHYILGLSPWCKIPAEWEPYLTPMYKHLGDDNHITRGE